MGDPFNVFLPDEQSTERLGARFAPLLQSGDTVLLFGEIGTGKTHFARALIKARLKHEGLPDSDVPSPTYTLVQTYDLTDCVIWHADLYRLGDPSEVAELGLDAAFDTDICLIEWPERMETLPPDALSVRFEPEGDGRRATCWAASDRMVSVLQMVCGQDA